MSLSLKKLVICLIGIPAFFAVINEVIAQETILDEYIQMGLQNNQGLKQNEFQLDRAVYALKEARSLFFPTVNVQGSYTLADGGRTINFPAGDLLNPVYESLNELTGSNSFSPTVQNVSEQLNPDNFYDIKLRTELPIVDTDLWYNRKIRDKAIDRSQAAVDIYKRELVQDIKIAYYRYSQAVKEVEIYQSAAQLVEENIRTSRSLYQNGVQNRTHLRRAKVEKEEINASLTRARNSQQNARNYFNFLLNRSLDSPISIDSSLFDKTNFTLPESSKQFNRREELTQLNASKQIRQFRRNMHRSHWIPTVNAFADLGSQGIDWQFDGDTQYYLVGINLRWNLFGSNRFTFRQKQAEASIDAVQARTNQMESSLQVEVQRAYNEYYAARDNYRSAEKQLELARQYYQDQRKRYQAGELLYIELLDAQNELTEARLRLAVSHADVRIAIVRIERSTASYPL